MTVASVSTVLRKNTRTGLAERPQQAKIHLTDSLSTPTGIFLTFFDASDEVASRLPTVGPVDHVIVRYKMLLSQPLVAWRLPPRQADGLSGSWDLAEFTWEDWPPPNAEAGDEARRAELLMHWGSEYEGQRRPV